MTSCYSYKLNMVLKLVNINMQIMKLS